MKIEEAIKQPRFNNVFQRVVINLIYSANVIRDEQVAVLKPFDILPQHFNVLRIIKGRHPSPISPGEIKEVMLDKANDLSRLLNKLEEKEWIYRKICPSNRRRVDVTLTNKGIQELTKASEAVKQSTNCIKERLSEEDATVLGNLLDKIRP